MYKDFKNIILKIIGKPRPKYCDIYSRLLLLYKLRIEYRNCPDMDEIKFKKTWSGWEHKKLPYRVWGLKKPHTYKHRILTRMEYRLSITVLGSKYIAKGIYWTLSVFVAVVRGVLRYIFRHIILNYLYILIVRPFRVYIKSPIKLYIITPVHNFYITYIRVYFEPIRKVQSYLSTQFKKHIEPTLVQGAHYSEYLLQSTLRYYLGLMYLLVLMNRWSCIFILFFLSPHAGLGIIFLIWYTYFISELMLSGHLYLHIIYIFVFISQMIVLPWVESYGFFGRRWQDAHVYSTSTFTYGKETATSFFKLFFFYNLVCPLIILCW